MITIPEKIGKTTFGTWIISIAAVLAFSAFGVCFQPQTSPVQVKKSGEELYKAACSSCHGHDGRGAPQQQVAFDVPVPDFSDCNFAAREPDADWIAVAHEGGPVRGFSRLMPAFGDPLKYEEIALIVEHVRTFCGKRTWPRGDLNFPRAMFTEKAFPEDEAVYTAGIRTEGQKEFSNELIYEKRFGVRNQLEFVVPFDWRNQISPSSGEKDWNGGVGDIALGVKRVFYHNLEKGSIFAATGEMILPTGNEDKGLGKGTVIFEPFVSVGQALPADFFLHAQAGLELPFNTEKAGEEVFLRAALGRTFEQSLFGRAWSPMLEVLSAREMASGAKISWDLVPQLIVTLNTRQHIMMNIAVRIPITDSGVRDTQVLVFLLWDWFDGGFFEGW